MEGEDDRKRGEGSEKGEDALTPIKEFSWWGGAAQKKVIWGGGLFLIWSDIPLPRQGDFCFSFIDLKICCTVNVIETFCFCF
jgi:hypothetical protein